MAYKVMNQDDFEVLSNIVDKDNIYINDNINKDMTHDELGTVTGVPEAHIQVTNKNQIMEIMNYANNNLIPVTVRGSGTGLVGACVATHGGILLDTTKMNKIIELDKLNMTLTVEPGVLLMEIYEFVQNENLFYAPDPGEKSATIGGNISTNAGGMRAVKYGVTRDWVTGLEVVLPNGELIKTGGKIAKNSTGYSIKDLIIGSEGTLGVIAEITLKLIPLPKKNVSLLIPFHTSLDALNAVSKIMVSHSIPTAVEFLESQSLKFSEEFLGKKIPNGDYEAYLLVSYDGDTDYKINNDVETISNLCIDELGAIDVYLVDTDERKASVWSARGAFLEAIKASTTEIDECDVVLPKSRICDFLEFTREISEQLEMRIPYFGHAGDGNLHIYFCKDDLSDDIWKEKLKIGFKMMYEKAFNMGGLVSGEHGIGFAKKEYMVKQIGETQINLMKGIKSVFDPKNILNPGKVI